MSSAASRRLLSLPLVLLAFLLVGTPEFPALQRAVSKAFDIPRVTVPPRFDPLVPDRGHRKSAPVAAPTLDVSTPGRVPARSRGVLVPLYLAYGALQALDADSTVRAIRSGGREANPLIAPVASKPAALVAVKAGLAASTVFLVEKVRTRSRRAAIVLMTALNAAYAAIVARNYQTALR